MSLTVEVPAPSRIVSRPAEESRGASLLTRAWPTPIAIETPTLPGIAASDVIDEVRQRMARRGIVWE